MEKDFLGFPIEEINGVHYIHVMNYKDARDCQELWNQDKEQRKIAFAGFPEMKKFQDELLPGFSEGYYIHLAPRY